MGSGPLYAWRYELVSRVPLNARTGRRTFPGALVRIGEGFACLHPWPELGDPAVEELLAALATGDASLPLVDRARECARHDALARAAGVSLLKTGGGKIPRSHATVPRWETAAIEVAVERGFERVKLKAGRDLEAEAVRLNDWCRRWPGLAWRLDFNHSADPAAIRSFLDRLPPEAVTGIDFLEDPFPYDSRSWTGFAKETGVRLALDRGVEDFSGGATVLVWKPALVDGALVAGMADADRLEVIATSSMDHPLGQCFAAAEAMKWDRVGVCGLQTHELFEATEFSERLGPAGPDFHPPPGTGLGFDALLEKLPWKRLK